MPVHSRAPHHVYSDRIKTTKSQNDVSKTTKRNVEPLAKNVQRRLTVSVFRMRRQWFEARMQYTRRCLLCCGGRAASGMSACMRWSTGVSARASECVASLFRHAMQYFWFFVFRRVHKWNTNGVILLYVRFTSVSFSSFTFCCCSISVPLTNLHLQPSALL